MSYAVVFLDIPYNQDYYLQQIKQIGDLSITISCSSDFKDMRSAIEFAFKNADGLFIVYPKKLWHKLQKIMLTNFERPSVFKEEAYIVASGFKKYGDGIFADIVYDKAIVFVPQDLDENFDFLALEHLLSTQDKIMGVFEGNINTQNTIFADEVYSLLKFNKNELLKLNLDKSKIFTYTAQECQVALSKVLKEKQIKLAIIDLSSGAYFASKVMSLETFKKNIVFCIDSCSEPALAYFFGLDEKYIKEFGYFSETFANEISSTALQFSDADCAIAIINNENFNKFLFFAYFKDNTFDLAIREFFDSYNIVRQKVASFAMLFLREFILSKNL